MLFKPGAHKENWEKYVWLIIPVASILLIVGALLNGRYFLGRSLLAWLPLFTVSFYCPQALFECRCVAERLVSVTQLIKIFGTGFWSRRLFAHYCWPLLIPEGEWIGPINYFRSHW